MKVSILLISLAVLAFRNAFNNDDNVTDANETAAYIRANYSHVEKNVNTTDDTSFVGKAIQSNQHEIMMAQLGLEKSSSAELKSLAQKIIADHTQLLQQFQALEGNTSANVTSGNDSMNSNSPDSVGVKNMYNNISGITFDRQWVSDMIGDHQRAISDFKTELSTTSDASLKALINTALPTMQQHLKQLQVLRGKMM